MRKKNIHIVGKSLTFKIYLNQSIAMNIYARIVTKKDRGREGGEEVVEVYDDIIEVPRGINQPEEESYYTADDWNQWD